MMRSAMRVQIKLVTAIDSEVRVGEEKPIVEKIVAEKYIKEFCKQLAGCMERHKVTYETTQLL